MTNSIDRVIDANLNRLKEGLRVIEDICRYIDNNSNLSYKLKKLRHKTRVFYSIDRLKYRDIENDVQKESIKSELSRDNLDNVIIANFSRTQESARVLEELLKLENIKLSQIAKDIRYNLYAIEKLYFIDKIKKE